MEVVLLCRGRQPAALYTLRESGARSLERGGRASCYPTVVVCLEDKHGSLKSQKTSAVGAVRGNGST